MNIKYNLATLLFLGVLQILCGGLPAASGQGVAPNENETLEKIKETGVITLGYREGIIPFSYLAPPHQPTGYSKELCDSVVKALKTRLDLPNLKVRYRWVNAQNRMPMLKSGEIDLECGLTSHTLERQQEVDFSVAHFVTSIRMLARKDEGIRDWSDIGGRAVVVTKGTTTEKLLMANADLKAHYNITLLFAQTPIEAFLMVRSGRAVAYVMDDIVLASLLASSKDPNAYEIVGQPLRTEPYAFMMRKGNSAFKQIVDSTLSGLMISGEAEKIYNRWFMNPLPPHGVNLRLPMSDELKSVFSNPTGRSYVQ